MSHVELIDLSRDFLRQAHAHAWVTVIAVKSPSSAYLGAQALVEADGTMHGWIGGGCVQGAVKAAAMRAIAADKPVRLRLSNDGEEMEGVDVQPMLCASNGEVELFIQPAAVAPRLRVYGGTPTAKSAAWFAREAGFEVTTDASVAEAKRFADAGGAAQAHLSSQPEPEAYALVATQGDNDELALEDALRSRVRAVLVVASARKAERLRSVMRMRGMTEERLADMHAPAGPDLGAVTPNEIALSAVAGLVALRRGKRIVGKPAKETEKSHGHAAAQVKPIALPSVGAGGYVNPVCGAAVDPATAMSSLTMQGQTHYFCCTGCRAEFERDPAKYLAIGAQMHGSGAGVEA